MSSRLSRLALVACAALCAPLVATAQSSVTIPASPAGALLTQWLTAFNAADSAGLEAFSAAHFPRVRASMYLQVRRSMGALDLVRIITSEPNRLTFTGRSRLSDAGVYGTLELTEGDPSQVKMLGVQGMPADVPVEGCTTWATPGTHGVSAADVASEDAIIAALYDVISGPSCQRRDWDRLRGLFAPGGRLIPTVSTAGTLGIRAQTPDEYIAAVRDGMEFLGFFEREVWHDGESFNGVVHRFSTYESRRAASDATPVARGINSIQLLNDGRRWWVVTVYWASERPNASIPSIYLPRP